MLNPRRTRFHGCLHHSKETKVVAKWRIHPFYLESTFIQSKGRFVTILLLFSVEKPLSKSQQFVEVSTRRFEACPIITRWCPRLVISLVPFFQVLFKRARSGERKIADSRPALYLPPESPSKSNIKRPQATQATEVTRPRQQVPLANESAWHLRVAQA